MTATSRRIDLSRTHLGTLHQSRLRLVNVEVHQLKDWQQPDLLPSPIHSPKRDELRRWTRVIELPGRPSARRGVFLRWKWHRQAKKYQPVIRWDNGVTSFSDLTILELEVRQLCLNLNI